MAVTLGLLAGGAGALALGQDVSGDLFNYHFYNGYALVAGRIDRDLAPAGHVSYFNPLVDALQYLGMRHLAPVPFSALLGAFQALNAVLAWGVARHLLGGRAPWLAGLAGLLAATGQNAISLLGTTYGDNTASVPALAALLATVGAERPGGARVAVAGALGGAAVGLKLTMAAPHVGLGALVLWLAWRQRRPALLAFFALGTLGGWTATNGWWALELWRRFGNPFFPFLNGVFGSAYLSPLPMWSPLEPWQWLRPAVDAAVGTDFGLESIPRDPRFLVSVLALAVWLVACGWSGQRGRVRAMPGRGLPLYWLVAYLSWAAVFHNYRYATVLEFLAPVLALVLLCDIWPRRTAVVSLALAGALAVATSPSPWWRARSWGAFWFHATLPAIARGPGQLVLLPEMKTSFAAPFFPADAAFVGLPQPEYRGPAMTAAIQARIDAHGGPLRVLARSPADHAAALAAFGLAIAGPGEWVRFGHGHRLLICPLERRPPGGECGE